MAEAQPPSFVTLEMTPFWGSRHFGAPTEHQELEKQSSTCSLCWICLETRWLIKTSKHPETEGRGTFHHCDFGLLSALCTRMRGFYPAWPLLHYVAQQLRLILYILFASCNPRVLTVCDTCVEFDSLTSLMSLWNWVFFGLSLLNVQVLGALFPLHQTWSMQSS